MKKIVTKLILIGMLSCVNALTNVMNAQSIAGGVDHSLFRCSSGVPEARGDSFYGQMGVSGLTGIIAVAAGYDHSMYLKNDGTVWGAGYNPSGALGNGANISIYSPVQAIGLTGITKIAAGKDYSLFIKNDGTAWGVGKNSIGQIGDGTQVSRNIAVQAVSGLGSITAIAAGGLHSLFVKSDGTAWGVGVDYNGQLGDGNGQFIPNHINPVQVLGLTGIIAVDAGESFSLFLKNDGTVWSTGSNSNGQLGDGTTVDKFAPVQVQGLTGITSIACGAFHSLFLKNDGTVWGVGRNIEGQLGDGSIINRYIPVQVSGLIGITEVAAGSYFSLFVKNNGTVWGTGYNYYGQLGDGTTINSRYPGQVLSLCNVNLGMTENVAENTINVYPNPCNEKLFIELDEYQNTTAELFNLQGQLLQSITLESFKTTLQIDQLTSGIYLVQVKSPKGMLVKKIVKK